MTAVGVDGGSNAAGQDPQGADGEVLLDIEVAGAAAPGASQVVYFAPNSDRGFVDAVTTAVHASPTPTVVSISWGQSEDSWTGQARTALDQAFADAAALGVTVTVAAGDNGSGDRGTDGKAHADFPASSPHALACGGTSLRVNTATGAVSAETVWNDGSGGGATGGGVSDTFGLPAWQASAGVPGQAGSGQAGRGVPDVAGNADPETGYQVLVDGQSTVVGGTSAVAPLWAALICRLAQATGKSFGLMQPLLYAGVSAGSTAAGFRDITQGNNGAYQAGPGWDACTGLGVPDGAALVSQARRLTRPRLPGVAPRASKAKAPATESQEPQATGGFRGVAPPGQQGQGSRDGVAGAAGHRGVPGGRSPGPAGPQPRWSRPGGESQSARRGSTWSRHDASLTNDGLGPRTRPPNEEKSVVCRKAGSRYRSRA